MTGAFFDSHCIHEFEESPTKMPDPIKEKIVDVLRVLVAITPWLISMYVLYWLGKNEIWTAETAFRDVMTIAIVAVGMGAAFVILSYLQKRVKE